MPTYNDQLNNVNALTNSLVFENTTRAITGTNHNLQELGQNQSCYDNLVAYDNYAYKVVRTYATEAANGQSLRDAYADAATFAGLSATNRFALLIPPGTYALGSTGLTLDTQFVDLIGLGRADETVITSVSNTNGGNGTIIQTTNDIKFRNLTIQNDAAAYSTGTDTDDSGYAPQGVFPTTEFTDCIFRNPGTGGDGAPFMRLGVEYGGTYQRCRGIDSGSGISVFFAIASGNYFDCHTSVNGFGYLGEASGIFTDSSCLDGFGFGADATGSFTRCTAFNSGFGSGGIASGTFNQCTALTLSFGWGDFFDPPTCSGTFTGCRATDNSFGNSTNTAVFINCTSGNNSFGQNGQTLSGTYKGCIGGDFSFGYGGGCIIQGTFEGCSAGDSSFGSLFPLISGASFINCVAGNASFGHNQAGIIGSYFVNCKAGNQSFGYGTFPGTPSSVDGGEFFGCTGGDECWSWLVPTNNMPRFINCSGGLDCFNGSSGLPLPQPQQGPAYYENCHSSGAGLAVFESFRDVCVSGSILKNCSSLGNAFSVCEGTLIGCYAPTGFALRPGATVIDCSADAAAFNFSNAVTGGYGVYDFTITNCSSGDQSFGYVGGSTISGGAYELAGTFTNCQGGDNSFGCTFGSNSSILFTGKAYNCTAGAFSFCSAVLSPAAGSHAELLQPDSYLENCHAGPGSFAGHGTGKKGGVMNNCSVRANDTIATWKDQGNLGGTMTNCQWVASEPNFPALTMETGAKLYGGIYRAGAGAPFGISAGSLITASIANILTNFILDTNITNNITSPNVIVDTDI
jgi:hypothetical protein